MLTDLERLCKGRYIALSVFSWSTTTLDRFHENIHPYIALIVTTSAVATPASVHKSRLWPVLHTPP